MRSARHDTLAVGTCEPGMYDPIDTSVITNGYLTSPSTSTSSPSSTNKKRGIDTVDSVTVKAMKSVVDLSDVIWEGNKIVESNHPNLMIIWLIL